MKRGNVPGLAPVQLCVPDSADMRARFRGAFLGCAIGDALGRPFEMMSRTDRRLSAKLDALLKSSAPLAYSDDTQMTIAVAESLLRVGTVAPDDVLATLAENYDAARGYGHGTTRMLHAFARGESHAATWADGSMGSGGAVRVVPIACVHHDANDLLASAAEATALVTHAHATGRAGAVAHAAALAAVLDAPTDRVTFDAIAVAILRHDAVARTPLRSKVEQIGPLLDASADGAAAVAALGNGLSVDEAMPLALFCFMRWAPDFAAVVRNTIACGGDTDTIAAMSGAYCGALVGEQGIDARWLERLENGPKGRDYLRALADECFVVHERGGT